MHFAFCYALKLRFWNFSSRIRSWHELASFEKFKPIYAEYNIGYFVEKVMSKFAGAIHICQNFARLFLLSCYLNHFVFFHLMMLVFELHLFITLYSSFQLRKTFYSYTGSEEKVGFTRG